MLDRYLFELHILCVSLVYKRIINVHFLVSVRVRENIMYNINYK